MNTIKLIGILTDIFHVETFDKFEKRVFWLKQSDAERYPQHWQLELHNQDVDQLNGMQTGDTLECEVEIRGKKYSKYKDHESIMVTLKCVGIRVVKKLDLSKNVGAWKSKPRRPTIDNGPELPL